MRAMRAMGIELKIGEIHDQVLLLDVETPDELSEVSLGELVVTLYDEIKTLRTEVASLKDTILRVEKG